MEAPHFPYFALGVALLPAILVCAFFTRSFSVSEDNQERFDALKLQAKRALLLSKPRRNFEKKYRGDGKDIEAVIGEINLCSEELALLNQVQNSGPFQKHAGIQTRIETIKGSGLEFRKEGLIEKKGVTEVHLKQIAPVEIESADLEKLLAIIEGECSSQLTIESLRLSSEGTQQRPKLNINLIQRKAQ